MPSCRQRPATPFGGQECPDDSAQVQQLLEALDAGPAVSARIPQACTVY